MIVLPVLALGVLAVHHLFLQRTRSEPRQPQRSGSGGETMLPR